MSTGKIIFPPRSAAGEALLARLKSARKFPTMLRQSDYEAEYAELRNWYKSKSSELLLVDRDDILGRRPMVSRVSPHKYNFALSTMRYSLVSCSGLITVPENRLRRTVTCSRGGKAHKGASFAKDRARKAAQTRWAKVRAKKESK